MSGAIDFYDLLRIVEAQQVRAEGFDDEGDMVDAFVACGGRADKTGHVRRETLVKVRKYGAHSVQWSRFPNHAVGPNPCRRSSSTTSA